jgi:uncharacterized protein
MAFQLLQPDLILGGNILTWTPAQIQSQGLRGLVLDVDDTIVSIASPQATPELLAWLADIRPFCKLWLVSNNPHRSRIEPIATALNIPFLLSAAKPSRKKLRQAVEEMDLPYEQVAMVGDRIFTDVLAGNRLGVFTVLVRPISESSKSFQFLRWAEFGLARLAGVSLGNASK